MELSQYKSTFDNLADIFGDVIDRYQWFSLLDSNKEDTLEVNSYVIQNIDKNLQKLQLNEGKDSYEAIRMISVLYFILREHQRVCKDNYSVEIVRYFEENWERMLTYCRSGIGWANLQDDIFWKDFAIARRTLIPVNAHVIETFSGFGFRQGYHHSCLQRMRFLLFLLNAGGRKGYFQIHLHVPNLAYFNEANRISCYLQIAKMLEKHKDIKGAFGISWFYDPKLKTVSPNLSYLHEFPLEGGAKLFYVGKDNTGNALARSKHRRELFDSGQYTPRSYLLVWPRKKLIEWAALNSHRL